MDRVTMAIKKIDELIDEIAADQKNERRRELTPLRVLTIVRRVLTQNKQKS